MKNKPKVGQPLHVQVALGAKPKDVVVSKGISAKTVPGIKGKK